MVLCRSGPVFCGAVKAGHLFSLGLICGLSRWLSCKESACQCGRGETRVRSLDREDPLEEEMATHTSILAWEIPWIEESDRLQSMGLQRVGHD